MIEERYLAGASWLHRLDARVKLALTLLFILSGALLPDGAWVGFLLSWALVLLATAASDLGLGVVVRRSFVALPFALAALTVIFTLPGRTVATLPLGPLTLSVSDAGLVRFASIVLRSWLAVQAAVLLTATTPVPEVLGALRFLQVPPLIVAVVGLMYRYLFVLGDEAQRLLRARESRSAALAGRRAGGSVAWRARTAGAMAGQLLLRSYERSDRIYGAMLARGYTGSPLALGQTRLQRGDWLVLGGGALALLVVQGVARLAR